MSVLLIVLGGTVALLLILLVVLLSFPVLLDLRLSRHEATRFALVARPFGGLGPSIGVVDTNRPRKPKPDRKKSDTQKQPKKRPAGGTARLGQEVLHLVRRLLRLIHFERLRVDGMFGLGDPAETGQLFGLLAPVIYGTGSRVCLEPVFDRACLEGECEATFKVRPIALGPPLFRFAWHVFGPAR